MSSNKAKVFCICGPSGSGKSSICKRITGLLPDVKLSVSTTSRMPREGEVEGVNYFFITPELFKKRIKENYFIEWAQYNGNYYGTSSQFLKNQLIAGESTILEIEVQGVQILKDVLPDSLVVIYISVPSLEELKKRLIGRGSETEDVIKQRLDKAKEEIAILESPGFSNHKVNNIDLDQSVNEVVSIINSYL